MKFTFDRHGVHRAAADAQAEAIRHIQHDLDHIHAHAEGKSVEELSAELHERLEHHGWEFDETTLAQWAQQLAAGDRILVVGDESGGPR